MVKVIVAINLIAERTAIKSLEKEVHEEKKEPLPTPDPLADTCM